MQAVGTGLQVDDTLNIFDMALLIAMAQMQSVSPQPNGGKLILAYLTGIHTMYPNNKGSNKVLMTAVRSGRMRRGHDWKGRDLRGNGFLQLRLHLVKNNGGMLLTP